MSQATTYKQERLRIELKRIQLCFHEKYLKLENQIGEKVSVGKDSAQNSELTFSSNEEFKGDYKETSAIRVPTSNEIKMDDKSDKQERTKSDKIQPVNITSLPKGFAQL